ncbi:hypothetical protein CYMTET_16787 [Cymbomonas tetramitiformis]|uniref:Right handed beta helix domain-containing protein n=1 Tax=Cymbomonas tetramitiformis TaxID=36881 RepID=A0AAE0GBJ1_9CHLO|nr:hypothetical protein CYMTET_16787 [Cymbomonas tetramitiformis]
MGQNKYGDLYQYGTGGALDIFHGQAGESSSVLLENCTFVANVASQAGGAVHLGVLGTRIPTLTGKITNLEETPPTIRVSKSMFRENYAAYGGGIRLLGGGNTTLHGCSFLANVVRYNGSAISLHIRSVDERRSISESAEYLERDKENDDFFDISTTLMMDGCTFSGNIAGSYILKYNGFGTVSIVLHPEHLANIAVLRSVFNRNQVMTTCMVKAVVLTHASFILSRRALSHQHNNVGSSSL